MSQALHKTILLIFLTYCSHGNIQCWWFDIMPIKNIIQEDPSIQYQKCFDPVPFHFQEFPLSINPSSHPNQGYFDETFILSIPHGTVQSTNGFTIINNHFIDEMIWKKFMHNLQLVQQRHYQPQRIPGRVAVITQPAYSNYFHWLTEMLCRLALLEISGMEYDYLYTPLDRFYIKETLDLWGVPTEKILAPISHYTYVQADTLIVPSLVSNSSLQSVYSVSYTHLTLPTICSV